MLLFRPKLKDKIQPAIMARLNYRLNTNAFHPSKTMLAS